MWSLDGRKRCLFDATRTFRRRNGNWFSPSGRIERVCKDEFVHLLVGERRLRISLSVRFAL
jgi:hypothetical protein